MPRHLIFSVLLLLATTVAVPASTATIGRSPANGYYYAYGQFVDHGRAGR